MDEKTTIEIGWEVQVIGSCHPYDYDYVTKIVDKANEFLKSEIGKSQIKVSLMTFCEWVFSGARRNSSHPQRELMRHINDCTKKYYK